MDRVTTTFAVTISSESAETVELFHGGALVHCNAIATTGLSYEQMLLANPFADTFCTSMNFKIAKGYAMMNPLVVRAEAIPAVLRFFLPLGTVRQFQANRSARWVLEDQAYEFFPETFGRVNSERTEVSVRPVMAGTLEFDE